MAASRQAFAGRSAGRDRRRGCSVRTGARATAGPMPTRRSTACSRPRSPTSASGAPGCRRAGAWPASCSTQRQRSAARFGAPEYTGARAAAATSACATCCRA
ncbi:MAG: hypothetical protein MZW92_28360 [Comamonadaceae bacterium]|nr:hypothetical protein [Comamonadaceae bacterium]